MVESICFLDLVRVAGRFRRWYSKPIRSKHAPSFDLRYSTLSNRR